MINHKLEGVNFETLNHGRQTITPKYIVLHYDGGANLTHTINYLKTRSLSYHLLIDRDGSITQGVPFNKRAWHAGLSNYRKMATDLNSHAIGISMGNRGPVNKFGDQFWALNPAGRKIGGPLNASQVIKRYHPNGGRELYWERYADEQVAACRRVCELLIAEYPSIMDIVGHDEIAIGRKIDPGPAFPIQSFYHLVAGRGAAENNLYRVDTPGDTLNIRRGPSSHTDINGALQDGQLVYGRSFAYKSGQKSNWVSLSLDGRHLGNGFVSGRYLKKV